MTKLRNSATAIVAALPVRYRSRAGAALATLGVIVSVLAVVCADRPEVAVLVQIATALGLVDSAPDTEGRSTP
ncbi:hypothetical protein ACH5AU_31335 [Streptomyces albidoflavus]